MKLKTYCRLFREQREDLYRIAYFYLGEEEPALEAVRNAACHCYGLADSAEDARSFKLQMTRGMLAESTINQNPNRYLTALYLRHMQQMDIPEIAYAMDIPEGSVKAYLDRAKSSMRQDTAGIGSEVRRVTAIRISPRLPEAVEEGFEQLASREQSASRRKLARRCFAGTGLVILAALVGFGIYFGLEREQQESPDQALVDMETDR